MSASAGELSPGSTGRPTKTSSVWQLPRPAEADISQVVRVVTVAAGRFVPGHLGALTQVVAFEMVDAALAETAGSRLGPRGWTSGGGPCRCDRVTSWSRPIAGLTLLLAAVVVLTIVCGAAKRAVPQRSAALVVMLGNLLYAGAVIAFIYGERSVVMGKHPMIQAGGRSRGRAGDPHDRPARPGDRTNPCEPSREQPRWERALLRFAAQHHLTGQCPARVEQQLSCSAMRYLRALAAMLDRPVVLAVEPELIGRLRALRKRRQRLRALGRGSR